MVPEADNSGLENQTICTLQETAAANQQLVLQPSDLASNKQGSSSALGGGGRDQPFKQVMMPAM